MDRNSILALVLAIIVHIQTGHLETVSSQDSPVIFGFHTCLHLTVVHILMPILKTLNVAVGIGSWH